jgi:hypothetical protein
MQCSRVIIDDPLCGQITVDHNPTSGAIFMEFERFESPDEVMPQYRVSLSTEHVAAWVESLLSQRGRRCRQCGSADGGKRLTVMLRLTGSDSNLVFYTHQGGNVILIRGGRVLKVVFGLHISVGEFLRRMKEEESDDTTITVAEGFASYVQGLMRP